MRKVRKRMACFIACILVIVVLIYFVGANQDTISQVDLDRFSIAKERRYLLYDVNPGEGFNLRRDVYMRVANLVRNLRDKGENFVLVLPPWGALYHWQTKSLSGTQLKLPWGLFFDLESLNRFVPVIEFETFLQETRKHEIDIVYYLQNYAEGWKDGVWEEKWDFRPCIDARYYVKLDDGRWTGWFWGYEDAITTKSLHCISIQGHTSTLLPLLLAENNTVTSILIDRAETVLHDHFGDVNYWKARRSMRYNKALRRIGDQYRLRELNSDDEQDQTIITEDWRQHIVPHGTAKGGPFLCVHWRRKDFVQAHNKELPSIEGTAKQINNLLEKLNLTTVFLATDAPDSEVKELSKSVQATKTTGSITPIIKRFIPPEDILQKYKDGGISIIDQWICAHARYFIGSHVSTFSFRIQDDREILGFDPSTSFNRLCPDDKMFDCEQPSQWKIVYD